MKKKLTDPTALKPDRKKALFLAKKQLPELVCDAVNLEGINFTLPEIQTLLDGVTVGGHKLQDETIALNQANAWRFLFDAVECGRFELTKNFVCDLHKVLGKEEALVWGAFRDDGVTIAGSDYTPPKSNELPALWSRLEKKHSSALSQARVDIDATYSHAIGLFLQMARAQFFYDCNKRAGRLMMNGVLLANGLPAINLPAKRQLEFNQLMLDFYAGGDERAMQNFMRDCLDERVVEIMSANHAPQAQAI